MSDLAENKKDKRKQQNRESAKRNRLRKKEEEGQVMANYEKLKR